MLREHAFPKVARLRRRPDFLRVQREGRRDNTAHFVLIAAPGTTAVARFGVTVSSRIGNAVVRNRIKRRLRELFRTRCPYRQGRNDVVVIAKVGAEALTYAKVVIELEGPLVAALRG